MENTGQLSVNRQTASWKNGWPTVRPQPMRIDSQSFWIQILDSKGQIERRKFDCDVADQESIAVWSPLLEWRKQLLPDGSTSAERIQLFRLLATLVDMRLSQFGVRSLRSMIWIPHAFKSSSSNTRPTNLLVSTVPPRTFPLLKILPRLKFSQESWLC